MCIVGYDDSKNALRIVNSWGTYWGDDGFLWLSYDLFEELCIYGCAVMYDVIEEVPELLPAPPKVTVSQGGHTDRIVLSWEKVEDAESYLVYRVNNEEGVLEELSPADTNGFSDTPLPPGVHYIYAVKSIKNGRNGRLISDFSEIAEGWTAEERAVPGIPANLGYTLFQGDPILVWDPVDNAEGYTIYRWDKGREDFLTIGGSRDSVYLDRTFSDIADPGIVYYIVEAHNRYGSGFATDNLAVLREIAPVREEEEAVVVSGEIRDDRPVAASRQTPFRGSYYRTDYFDYEYTMARFREYYEREMEAFRSFRQGEEAGFDDWKREQEEALQKFQGR